MIEMKRFIKYSKGPKYELVELIKKSREIILCGPDLIRLTLSREWVLPEERDLRVRV